MKNTIFLAYVILFPFIGKSQDLNQKFSDNLRIFDTIKVYNCKYAILQHGNTITYKINDEIVTKEEYKRISKGQVESKKCNPCVLKRLNLDNSVESQGMYYYTCPGRDEMKEDIKKTKNGENHNIQINSCNDGEWRYYSKEGELLEIKYFDHGTEVKEKTRLFQ